MTAAPAIVKSSKIDSEKTQSKYLLPYQVRWIQDESRLKMWEKSIRIGATYAQELSAIRDRVRFGSDYLHSSVTQDVALLFVEECDKFWMPLFGIVAQSRGVMDWDKKNDVKAFYIQFQNGAKILSFSSNPASLRGFGGDVGVDEIAFHRDLKGMLAAAGGRAMWGDKLRIWSSHNGVDSEWNKKLEEERANPNTQWSIHRTTLPDAIEDGLVEKINAVKGTNMTREGFVEQTISLVGGMSNYEEECLCVAKPKGVPLVSRSYLVASVRAYEALTVRLDGKDVEVETITLDGKTYDMINVCAADFLRSGRLAEALAPYAGARIRAGYDVARTGDLSSIFVEVQVEGRWRMAANVILHKCKFRSGYAVMRHLMRAWRAVGAGDATGLGMQTCEDLADEFPDRFVTVNFSAKKMELCTLLARNYEAGLVERPASAAYVIEDAYSLKHDLTPAGNATIAAGKNPLLPESHGDVAMSEALATYAHLHCEDLGPAAGMLSGELSRSAERDFMRADNELEDLPAAPDRLGGY